MYEIVSESDTGEEIKKGDCAVTILTVTATVPWSYERTDNKASCKTLEQLIPRLSARFASHAGRETFFLTAFVSVALRY